MSQTPRHVHSAAERPVSEEAYTHDQERYAPSGAGYGPTAPGHPGGLCCGGAVATARVHFHTGRPHAHLLGYEEARLDGIPEDSLESFAGTGNPFSLGALQLGQLVVDVGCGAGLDSVIAVRMVGPHGRVTGFDMTPAMLEKACRGASATGLTNVAFREG